MPYPRLLRLLHWSIALMVVVQLCLILIFHQLQSLDYGAIVLSAHRQCGTLVLILVCVRVIAAFWLKAPAQTGKFPAWQSFSASAVHLGMLGLLVGQPVLGFLVAWSRGDDVVLFGLVRIPALLRLETETGQSLEGLHKWIAYSIIALVAVHLGAVAFNAVIRKIWVMDRMLGAPVPNTLINRVPFVAQLTLCTGLTLILAAGMGIYVYYDGEMKHVRRGRGESDS